MNRGFVFDSDYWLVSIRYCIIRLLMENIFPHYNPIHDLEILYAKSADISKA